MINEEDKNNQKIIPHSHTKVIPINHQVTHDLHLQLKLFGDHSYMNAAHAYHAALESGGEDGKIRKGLSEFSGTARRMEYKGEVNGAPVYDDYGHHPTEIIATLKAVKGKYPDKRLVCVYQPHQYARTYQLLDGFKEAFTQADMVIVPGIYEARDTEDSKSRSTENHLPKASIILMWSGKMALRRP